MAELLEGHSRRIKDNLGLSRDGFLYIKGLLKSKGGLKGTRYIRTTEILRIFLYTVTIDLSIRKLVERF